MKKISFDKLAKRLTSFILYLHSCTVFFAVWKFIGFAYTTVVLDRLDSFPYLDRLDFFCIWIARFSAWTYEYEFSCFCIHLHCTLKFS